MAWKIQESDKTRSNHHTHLPTGLSCHGWFVSRELKNFFYALVSAPLFVVQCWHDYKGGTESLNERWHILTHFQSPRSAHEFIPRLPFSVFPKTSRRSINRKPQLNWLNSRGMVNKICYSWRICNPYHVIGFSDLFDLWVIKIKKPTILCARTFVWVIHDVAKACALQQLFPYKSS